MWFAATMLMHQIRARRAKNGAMSAVAEVAERFDVGRITIDELEQWQADTTRTTYLFDVRTPAEFAAGHLSGSRNAPGGQLVQATDEYAATRNARLILVDDNGVRATMTASLVTPIGVDRRGGGSTSMCANWTWSPAGWLACRWSQRPSITVSELGESSPRGRRSGPRCGDQPEVPQEGSHSGFVLGRAQPFERSPGGGR